MSGFAKIKRGCCFVRFQPCQDSESRGDRYEEKILADIIPFRRFGGTFIVTVHVSSRLDNGDLMFSDTGIGSKYYRGKIWMEIFTRESGNQKGYNLSDRKNTRISLWSYFGGRSMASSLEHFWGIRNKWLKLLIRIPFSYVRLVAISGWKSARWKYMISQ